MTISNKGKTSNTFIDDNHFVKEDASYSGYSFQKWCESNLVLPPKFGINRALDYSHGVAKYDIIAEEPWKLDYTKVGLIGKAMGEIHSQSRAAYESGELKFLKTKSFKAPTDLTHYDISPAELDLRNEVLQSVDIDINTSTPKLPLHRDFRLHNILSDGNKLWLIDFDYAAVDIVSHELVAMMLDISYHGLHYVETFIREYLRHSSLNISDVIVDEHMYYLATDTFPYDRKSTLSDKNYNLLCDERTSRLNRLKVFRKDFKDFIRMSLESK